MTAITNNYNKPKPKSTTYSLPQRLGDRFIPSLPSPPPPRYGDMFGPNATDQTTPIRKTSWKERLLIGLFSLFIIPAAILLLLFLLTFTIIGILITLFMDRHHDRYH